MELKLDRRCSSAKTTHNIKDEDEHNQQESGCRLWTITCGTKNGLLHVERLKRGETCIHCEGCWLTPNDFERFGGKGSTRKWKATIFHKEKSLEFYFKEGVLSTEGYTVKPRTKKQDTSLPSKCEPGDLELPSRERRKAANTARRRVASLQLCLEDSSDDDDGGGSYLGSREQVMLKEEEEDDSDEEQGINTGDAESEEDEEEWNEPEDEYVLTDMDQSADEAPTKELDPKMIISTPRIFQPKVLLKRLVMGDCQTINLKRPTEDISTAAPRFLVGINRDDDDSQMTPETCHNPNNLGPSSLPLTSSCHTASTEGRGQKRNKKQQEAKAYLDRTARRRVEAREKRCERREVEMSESLKRIATALELLSSKLDTAITLLQRLTDQK